MKRFECKNCGHFRCVTFGTKVLSNKSFECKEKIFKTKWYEIDEEEEKEEIKETPQWCEMERIVYHQNEYLKVVGEIGFAKVILSNGKQVSILELAEARLRPFNETEMRELVGKVIECKSKVHIICSFIQETDAFYVRGGVSWYSPEALLRDYTLDGKPCGVYEHLKNGEWVK